MRLQLETCAKHKPCGVDYELRLFLADELDEKGIATLETDPNAVCLALKKVALASAALLVQPSLKVGKRFLFSSRKLFLEVTLDRDVSDYACSTDEAKANYLDRPTTTVRT